MKTYYHKAGHRAGETMTVKELVDKLQEYPEGMPVFAEWESVWGWVKPMNFRIEKADKERFKQDVDTLIIWVEDY